MEEISNSSPSLPNQPRINNRKFFKPIIWVLLILILAVLVMVSPNIFNIKKASNFNKNVQTAPVPLREASSGKLVSEFPPQLIILPGTEVLESKLIRMSERTDFPDAGNWVATTKVKVPLSQEEAINSYLTFFNSNGYTFTQSIGITTGILSLRAYKVNEKTNVTELVQVSVNGIGANSTIILSYNTNTQK